MKIDFNILSLPDLVGVREFVAFTEGELFFSIDGVVFFHIENCLLVEFYVVLIKWLMLVEEVGWRDFYYVSMDEEEEPVVAFTLCDKTDFYKFESCWLRGEYIFSAETVRCCAEGYVRELRSRMLSVLGVDVCGEVAKLFGLRDV